MTLSMECVYKYIYKLPEYFYYLVPLPVKPLSATILNKNQGLSADRKYEVVCQAVGSRPPAKITWWKDNKRLESFVEKVSPEAKVLYGSEYFVVRSNCSKSPISCPHVLGRSKALSIF
jgi:hypothetical protein